MIAFHALSDGSPMGAAKGLAVQFDGAVWVGVWVGVWEDPRDLLLRRFDSFTDAEQECFHKFGLRMTAVEKPNTMIAQIFETCMTTKMQLFAGLENEYWYLRHVLELDAPKPVEPQPNASRRHTTNIVTGGVNHGIVAHTVNGDITFTDGQPFNVDGYWD